MDENNPTLEETRKKDTPIKYGRSVFEIATIVFGVLLGLWLNGLNENRKQKHFTEKTVAVILDELDDNYEAVLKARDYHMGLLPHLVELRTQTRLGEEAYVENYYGFGTAQVSKAAYDTALSTGVFARLEPAYTAKIAKAYASLNAMDETSDRYKLSLSNSPNPFSEIMAPAFADILYTEDKALKDIAPLIEKTAPNQWTDNLDVDPY